MRREFHVRFCEGPGVRFPRATRLGETAGNDPIRALHAAIGSRLAAFRSITKVEKVPSTNVRGPETENQQWRKQT